MFVAVIANGTLTPGVAGPEDDWRIKPGQPGNDRLLPGRGRGIRSDFVVTHLDNALHNEYKTDAFLVGYVLRDHSGQIAYQQPRINISGVPFVESLGYKLEISVLFADIDNPKIPDGVGGTKKQPWTPELLSAMRALERRLGDMGLRCGIYYSKHGCRIVQPLSSAISIREFKRLNAWLLGTLNAVGFGDVFTIDTRCKDWGRHFALPYVRKPDGTDLRLRMCLDYMRPIEPHQDLRGRVPGQKRDHGPEDDDADPRTYTNVGDVANSPLAQAFALAGMLGNRISKDKQIALCPWRSDHSFNSDWKSNTIVWAASVENPLGNFLCSHEHAERDRRISQEDVYWALPENARELLPKPEKVAKKKIPEAPPPPQVSKEEAATILRKAFHEAPEGPSVVAATCGSGKTQQAINVGVDWARRGKGLFGKMAISVPTNELAIELTARARLQGVSVQRIFGPPSLKDPVTKAPVCKIHKSASAIAGGVSVPYEYCQGRGHQRCDHYDGCAARDGVDGPDDARIVIGPHKMLSVLCGVPGQKGLLVIDEPSSLIVNQVITEDDLREVFDSLDLYFDSRYSAVMRLAVDSLLHHFRTAAPDRLFNIKEATRVVNDRLLDEAGEATGGCKTVVECAHAAFLPSDLGRRRPAPPIQRSWIESSKKNPRLAAKLGKTSQIVGLIHSALTDPVQPAAEELVGLSAEEQKKKRKPERVLGRVENRGRERVLVLASPDVQFENALTREGRTVVADAGGRHLMPAIMAVWQTKTPFKLTEVFVHDGAPIERTILRIKASKTSLFPDDELKLTPAFLRMLRSAINWALDRKVQKVALITFKKLREAFEEILVNKVKPPKSDKEALLRWEIGRELCRLPRPPDFGHYGAIRGLDHWKDHDCLITLGDPRPNLSDGKFDAMFLEIEDWETRYGQLAASELEQAHGRLRTVHRTTPAFALHVGTVTPSGGHAWTSLQDRGGCARTSWLTKADVESAIRLAGSIRAAARVLGVDEKTIRRILNNHD